MILDMLKYYTEMKENHISIVYNGPIWADGVEGIGQTLRKRLEYDELPLVTSQSVFSVFVEQMYNMLYYSAERQQLTTEAKAAAGGEGGTSGLPVKTIPAASGVFIMGATGKQYFIQCGNQIKNDQIPLVKERIDYLNTLDKPELRKYYKERIKAENDNPDSRGAGIGLIEIARRSSSKMEYSFTPLEDGYSFFTLYVTVG